MNIIFQIYYAFLIASIFSVSGYAMDNINLKKENSRSSPDDDVQPKRRKLNTAEQQNNLEDDESKAKKLSFLNYQNKVRYFRDFRSQMERKFSYWGSALGKILDKLDALYLDKASDKSGVFVIGSMPGVGKNTLVKHIRDFLEMDPFAYTESFKTRFQLIKDKNKKIFDQDILKNTGASERLRKGIYKIVVIDEIQSMTKDYGTNNLANELWFHAFGDAEININNEAYIADKKLNTCTAMKKNFDLKIQFNSNESEIAKLTQKHEDAKKQDPNVNPHALAMNLSALEKRREELQESMGFVLDRLTVELRELKSEVPHFFTADELKKSPEVLARSFLDSDTGTIERRFINAPNYKNLYFDRNIYIFLGNPAKINDSILEEIERSANKGRDALRTLAKKRLTEPAIRSWFISNAS